MALTSVSGLVSGLDTATIIRQLMQIEAQPQTQLRTKLSTEKSAITALQSINAKLVALGTKAADLDRITNWSPVSVTSTSDKVTVTAGSTAQPGTYSFTVNQTAAAHQLVSDSLLRGTDVVSTDPQIVVNGKTVSVGSGTLDEVVAAINGADAGVTASTVQVGTDPLTGVPLYRLRVTADETGASSSFTVTDSKVPPIPLAMSVSTAGKDASVTIGADTVTSASNTFSQVFNGLTFTLAPSTAANTSVDLAVTRDSAAAKTALKGLVDAANEILATITTATAYAITGGKAGPLSGDSTLRDVRNSILATVTTAADGRSLAGIGIQLDRTGKITLDEAKFDAAYATDPKNVGSLLGSTSTWSTGSPGTASVYSASWRVPAGSYAVNSAAPLLGDGTPAVNGTRLTGAVGSSAEGLVVDASADAVGTLTYVPGFAARLESVMKWASDSVDGSVTTMIQGRQTMSRDLETAISSWDVRLDLRRASLEKTYAALEVALGKLQSQSSWLAGQINSLPSWNQQ
jgi:flagellar hook-associated protein 2